jgi:thiazole/oxazole-forming peptide maturase SagD family component
MATAAPPGLRAGWMVAAVPSGVVVVGPSVEVHVTVPGDAEVSRALATAVAQTAPDPAARPFPGVPADAHARLVALLQELGALGVAPAPVPGHALAAAIADARRGAPPEGVVWTAEEALVLPPGLDVRTRTRALRAFVGALRPDGRLDGYALLARGTGAVHGDVPDGERLRTRVREAAVDGSIAVVELTEGGRAWHVAPDQLDRIGAAEPHRLGPITHAFPPVPVDAELPDLWLCVAETAVANLNVVAPARERAVQGVGDAARARLVAHAEGAERYAAGEPSAAALVRARRDELPAAVDPRTLYARADAAPADGQDEAPRLWAPVTARDGTRRWVPAETVYTSIVDPAPASAVLPWTSSGLAAGLDLAGARRRAFCELVERDAFMWTWLRRISRERVSARGVPEDVADMTRVLARRGWTTRWVNLTLDTLPVILCCLTHEREGLTVGAACDAAPSAALRRATVEALVLALRLHYEAGERPLPQDVRTPRDHLLLHRDPARRADHEFLYAGGDEVELGDIPDGCDDDLEGLLDDLGHPPLTADLTLPACQPYHVVRALAPGLVPVSFGWRREPTGLPRVLEHVVSTRTGRRYAPEPDDIRDRVSHPFP